VSIEFLYTDEDLRRLDSSQRRLFISTEFDDDGRHKEIENVEFGIDPKTRK